MTNRQFTFSFTVGIMLVALGGVLLTQATIGFSLIALGAAIATLALFTRGASKKSGQALPSRAQARTYQNTATDY